MTPLGRVGPVWPSDGDLAAARAGCPYATNRLLGELRPQVLAFCRSRLATYAGGHDIAEDVAQEACVAVFRSLHRYQDRGLPFDAWVYAITANKIADAQREFGRGPVLIEDLPELVEPSPTPEEQAMAAVRLRILAELLGHLSDRTRAVVVLRAGGASVQTVADRLGLSAAAVRVIQHRATRRLRRLVSRPEQRRSARAGAPSGIRHRTEPAA